jgi:putative ABC transport system permease protein
VLTLLVAVTVFFATLGASSLADQERQAVGHNPYDIAFAEPDDRRRISDDTLLSIIHRGGSPLLSRTALEYQSSSGFVILSDESLNSAVGSTYHVAPGAYISLQQVMLDDNYPHSEEETFHPPSVDIQGRRYVSQGGETRVLFNNVRLVTMGAALYVILSHDDFSAVVMHSGMTTGRLTLLRFGSWHQTDEVHRLLAAELERHYAKVLDSPGAARDAAADALSSRNEFYMAGRQSINLSLFLFTFVGLLFFLASPILLHFRLLTEFESERKKYRKLFLLGIDPREVARLVGRELSVFFFLPFTLGVLLALSTVLSLPAVIGDRALMARYLLIICGAYLAFESLAYLVYQAAYGRKLLASMGFAPDSARI